MNLRGYSGVNSEFMPISKSPMFLLMTNSVPMLAFLKIVTLLGRILTLEPVQT